MSNQYNIYSNYYSSGMNPALAPFYPPNQMPAGPQYPQMPPTQFHPNMMARGFAPQPNPFMQNQYYNPAMFHNYNFGGFGMAQANLPLPADLENNRLADAPQPQPPRAEAPKTPDVRIPEAAPIQEVQAITVPDVQPIRVPDVETVQTAPEDQHPVETKSRKRPATPPSAAVVEVQIVEESTKKKARVVEDVPESMAAKNFLDSLAELEAAHPTPKPTKDSARVAEEVRAPEVLALKKKMSAPPTTAALDFLDSLAELEAANPTPKPTKERDSILDYLPSDSDEEDEIPDSWELSDEEDEPEEVVVVEKSSERQQVIEEDEQPEEVNEGPAAIFEGEDEEQLTPYAAELFLKYHLVHKKFDRSFISSIVQAKIAEREKKGITFDRLPKRLRK